MTHPPTLSLRGRTATNPNLILGSAYGVGSPTNPSMYCPHRGGGLGHPYGPRFALANFAGLQRAIYANTCDALGAVFTFAVGLAGGLAGALRFAYHNHTTI